MSKILAVDDFRECGWATKVVKTYSDAIKALQEEHWDELYLDHDLGYYIDGDSKTGYDILCWLEINVDKIPKEIFIISSNPSGRERMELVLNKFRKLGYIK